MVTVKEWGFAGKLQLEELSKNFGDGRSGVWTGRMRRRSPVAIVAIIYQNIYMAICWKVLQ